jgi:exopolysaccharide biosynthesis protein
MFQKQRRGRKKWRSSIILLRLLLFLSLITLQIINARHIVIPRKPDDAPFKLEFQKIRLKYRNAYLAIISGVSPSSYFNVAVKDSICSLEKTSSFANRLNCDYAVNAGPFESFVHGGCIGLTISNGTLIHSRNIDKYNTNSGFHDSAAEEESNISFGITFENEWILGNVESKLIKGGSQGLYKVKELVTGLHGWLVYNTTIAVLPDEFASRRAPRTAIGIDRLGQKLVVLQVDGCEKCMHSLEATHGLTLYELAHLMTDYADYAINLDGGGSSTSVLHGRVVNRPTCLDYLDFPCERPVASVICIREDVSGVFRSQQEEKTIIHEAHVSWHV